MSDEKRVSVNVGGGFTGLLTIAFIVLKLCGVIDWAWVWVLAPLWIGAALIVGLIIIILILYVIGNIIN